MRWRYPTEDMRLVRVALQDEAYVAIGGFMMVCMTPTVSQAHACAIGILALVSMWPVALDALRRAA